MTSVETILRKAIVGSPLSAAGWNTVAAGIRDQAFFSSRVEEIRHLEILRRNVATFVGGSSISDRRQAMRQALAESGYLPDAASMGTIKDLYSKARLDVILKHNAATVRGYVNHLDATTPGAFAAFPCQEFLRTQRRHVERTTWPERWRNAGGRFFQGSMIAIKDDPVWTRLSAFGHPYPPFDWGSGMGVRDISRRESLALGVITEGEIKTRRDELAQRQEAGDLPKMTDGLATPIASGSEDFYRAAFGDQVEIVNGLAKWSDITRAARPMRLPSAQGFVTVTPDAVRQAGDLAAMIPSLLREGKPLPLAGGGSARAVIENGNLKEIVRS